MNIAFVIFSVRMYPCIYLYVIILLKYTKRVRKTLADADSYGRKIQLNVGGLVKFPFNTDCFNVYVCIFECIVWGCVLMVCTLNIFN